MTLWTLFWLDFYNDRLWRMSRDLCRDFDRDVAEGRL